MRKLEQPLTELYTHITHSDKLHPAVSSVNVGWHIEHSLLVIQKISETVLKSDPSNYKWTFNWARSLAFMFNSFPRGKGRAPDIVKPKQTEITDYDTLFASVRSTLEELKNANEHQYFLHPIFGNLHKKNTFIMLDIHTRHHLKIIRDILST
jgi:hypothetical protein